MVVEKRDERSASRPSRESLTERLRARAARGPIVVAHRGDSGRAPENTLPAFDDAVALGADMVELDYHATADGVLVCIHDATLDRTTDVRAKWGGEKVRVDRTAFARLAELDAGSWKESRFAGATVPSLEAALRAIQRASVTMIEHKAGTPESLVALLRRLDLVDDVLVQSFDWDWLARVHALEPRLTLAALGGTKRRPTLDDAAVAAIRRTGAIMVHWDHEKLGAAEVARAHAEGWLVCVYTANEVAEFERLVAIGVDAITTNEPARLQRQLGLRSGRRDHDPDTRR